MPAKMFLVGRKRYLKGGTYMYLQNCHEKFGKLVEVVLDLPKD
jgi:hypothetical protein